MLGAKTKAVVHIQILPDSPESAELQNIVTTTQVWVPSMCFTVASNRPGAQCETRYLFGLQLFSVFCVLFLNPGGFVYILRWLVCALVFTCSHAVDERECQLLAA